VQSCCPPCAACLALVVVVLVVTAQPCTGSHDIDTSASAAAPEVVFRLHCNERIPIVPSHADRPPTTTTITIAIASVEPFWLWGIRRKRLPAARELVKY
jgi:hypothetical protein